MAQKKYSIECTEEQLWHIARCVEDCHRLAAGDASMSNTIAQASLPSEMEEVLRKAEPLITALPPGGRYGWNGGRCPNENQRRFIAETYPIYREIYHFLAGERGLPSVYSSPTLTCAEGGKPIKIKRQ